MSDRDEAEKDPGNSDANSSHDPSARDSEDYSDSALTGHDPAQAATAPDDFAAIGREVRRQFDLVPSIGRGWRWYDIPYRALRWIVTGWRSRFIPWRLRLRLNHGMHFLSVINHYERLKVEERTGPRNKLIVPDDEEVTQGAIWVVEFFPPSHYEDLLRSLKKNGWGDGRFMYMGSIDGSNAEQVARARRGSGFEWSRLGSVVNPSSPYLVMDAKREVLPPEFDLVELTGVQIGTSLTAVVAFVCLSDKGRRALNDVWKAEHEPIFEWRGLQTPHVEGRYFSAIRATQRERQRLHDVARTWLADRCAGFFAQTEARQPVVDFNMLKQFDPTTATASRAMDEPLRALAMGRDYFYNFVSPQIPGAVLRPGEALRPPREALQNCWGVVGAYQTFSDANDSAGYGTKPYAVTTLARMVDDPVRAFLLHTAVLRYARQLKERAADQRDTARSQHRNFSPRQLDALKRDLLTTSLDLPAVARDTEQLWDPRWRQREGVDIKAVPAPGIPHPPGEYDMIDELGKSRAELFESLITDDAGYRAVLATTSSLGASAASARLGRGALLVSLTSLLVSATTLVVVNGSTVWDRIADWFRGF